MTVDDLTPELTYALTHQSQSTLPAAESETSHWECRCAHS